MRRNLVEGRLTGNVDPAYTEALLRILRDIRSEIIIINQTMPTASLLIGNMYQEFVGANGQVIDAGLGGGSGYGTNSATATDASTWGGRRQGLEYTNATINSVLGRSGATSYFRVGSATDGGGINLYVFGRIGSTFATTAGLLSGLIVNPSVLTATPGTSSNNGFMVAYIDAGAANWKLGVRDRPSSVNSYDTGIAWATNQFYAVRIYQAKGNAAPCEITFATFNSTTGASTVASNVFTTGFPTSSDTLGWFNGGYTAAGGDKVQWFRSFAVVQDDVFTTLTP